MPALVVPNATSRAAGAQLSLAPQPVPGVTVKVAGTPFPKRIKIQLAWDGKTAGMPQARADGCGRFTATFTIASTAALGKHE